MINRIAQILFSLNGQFELLIYVDVLIIYLIALISAIVKAGTLFKLILFQGKASTQDIMEIILAASFCGF